jgi:hypothetical protein
MADIQLGTLKPAYLAKAAQLDQSSLLSTHLGSNAEAKARHPASRGRRAHFVTAARDHLNARISNMKEASTIKAKKTGSMPEGRSANFAENATMN